MALCRILSHVRDAKVVQRGDVKLDRVPQVGEFLELPSNSDEFVRVIAVMHKPQYDISRDQIAAEVYVAEMDKMTFRLILNRASDQSEI